jgi:RNA recognition motif-containing protein
VSSEADVNARKLYVGGLPEGVTDEQLAVLFSSYGQIMRVNIMLGRGFGFVEMAHSSAADVARDALDGYWWHGSKLKTAVASPPGRPRPQA